MNIVFNGLLRRFDKVDNEGVQQLIQGLDGLVSLREITIGFLGYVLEK